MRIYIYIYLLSFNENVYDEYEINNRICEMS